MTRKKKPWKKLRISLLVFALVCILGYGALWIYASDYRTLQEEYYPLLDAPTVNQSKGLVHFDAQGDTALVFYPGGRVEYLAYTPLCVRLQEKGIQVFLVDMPFNMANFGINKANDLMRAYPSVKNWYVGGHSLGGVAASLYASWNSKKINGLVMVGIYNAMEYPLENTLTLVGSNDLRVGDSIDYTQNVHILQGGNHAQFGNYGQNTGDGIATISAEEQQIQAVNHIVEFIKEHNR